MKKINILALPFTVVLASTLVACGNKGANDHFTIEEPTFTSISYEDRNSGFRISVKSDFVLEGHDVNKAQFKDSAGNAYTTTIFANDVNNLNLGYNVVLPNEGTYTIRLYIDGLASSNSLNLTVEKPLEYKTLSMKLPENIHIKGTFNDLIHESQRIFDLYKIGDRYLKVEDDRPALFYKKIADDKYSTWGNAIGNDEVNWEKTKDASTSAFESVFYGHYSIGYTAMLNPLRSKTDGTYKVGETNYNVTEYKYDAYTFTMYEENNASIALKVVSEAFTLDTTVLDVLVAEFPIVTPDQI